MSTTELVPALTPAQKSLVVSHYLHHRAPQVVYRRLWSSDPPCSPSAFVRLYTDAVIEFLNPIGERAKSALGPLDARNVEVLARFRDLALQAAEDVVDKPTGEPDDKGHCEDRLRLLPGLIQAGTACCRQLQNIRSAQVSEAAALHSLLMSNAGADDGADD